jgi:hypothetical protein
MTEKRRFKKRVRSRMAKTGESYLTAYRYFRNQNAENLPMEFQSISRIDLGIALDVPSNWKELVPNPGVGTLEGVVEVMHFENHEELEKAKGLDILSMPNPEGQSLKNVVQNETKRLQRMQFTDFSYSEISVGGCSCTRIDCENADSSVWSLRLYLIKTEQNHIWWLFFGSFEMKQDNKFIEKMTGSFKLLEPLQEGFLSQIALMHYDEASRAVIQRSKDAAIRLGESLLLSKHIISGLAEDDSVKERMQKLGIKSDIHFDNRFDPKVRATGDVFVHAEIFRLLTVTIPTLAGGIVKPVHILTGVLDTHDEDEKPSGEDRPFPENVRRSLPTMVDIRTLYNIDDGSLTVYGLDPSYSWIGEQFQFSLKVLDEIERYDVTGKVDAIYEKGTPGRDGVIVVTLDPDTPVKNVIESYLTK